MYGAFGRRDRGPVAAVPLPHVLQRRGGGAGSAAEQDDLLRSLLRCHGVAAAGARRVLRGEQGPLAAVPGPRVGEVLRAVVAAEQDHLVGGPVVGQRAPTTSTRAGREGVLGPLGAVPGPGVTELLLGDVLATEHDQLAAGDVVGHRTPASRRRAADGGVLGQVGPVGAVEAPEVVVEGRAVQVAAERVDRDHVGGQVCVAAGTGGVLRAELLPLGLGRERSR